MTHLRRLLRLWKSWRLRVQAEAYDDAARVAKLKGYTTEAILYEHLAMRTWYERNGL